MTSLVREKLHAKYLPGASKDAPSSLRYYTLTHSDLTGDLFLSIGGCYDKAQIAKTYTRLMKTKF